MRQGSRREQLHPRPPLAASTIAAMAAIENWLGPPVRHTRGQLSRPGADGCETLSRARPAERLSLGAERWGAGRTKWRPEAWGRGCGPDTPCGPPLMRFGAAGPELRSHCGHPLLRCRRNMAPEGVRRPTACRCAALGPAPCTGPWPAGSLPSRGCGSCDGGRRCWASEDADTGVPLSRSPDETRGDSRWGILHGMHPTFAAGRGHKASLPSCGWFRGLWLARFV
jgi:hypothetical protein